MGPELARKFATLDVRTLDDLVALYPRDYKDWRTPTPIAEIVRAALSREHDSGDPDSSEAIALGRIVRVAERRARVPVVAAEIEDDTGRLTATWFGRRGLRLREGERIFVHGRAAAKRTRGTLAVELNVLHHKPFADDETYRGEIVPVYRASKDLQSRTIAATIARNFDSLAGRVPDVLPGDVLRAHGYGPLSRAWREAQRPPSPEVAAAARERLTFEQFFALALAAAVTRAERAASGGAPALVPAPGLLARFEDSLPFRFTGAQRRAIDEIWYDLARTAPMNRLLQGDVGSGKTLVAAAAIVLAAASGVQSALMAPTEILASQHAQKLAPLLLPFGIRVDALFGSVGVRERTAVRARLSSGECDLVVGTHALIEEGVEFRNLGLAVIDEQHRFGVAQRARLRAKSGATHTLHMTATPIPRSLAQTKYADLDLSIIDELPPGRTPIETFVLRERRKDRAYQFVVKNVLRGQQAYVVAPAIDESESALTSVVSELERLRAGVFSELRVELLHGRMPSREKDGAMRRFERHEADVLLATTVVEVGVDVPNASVMVILDAHRYGLAQLHQLRGRVGRGAARSYCVLIGPDDRESVERLEILARTTDGFEIAEEDLRLRGVGEFAGRAQSGGIVGPLGSILSDFALYMQAKASADRLVARDPTLGEPDHVALRTYLGAAAASRATLLSS